MADSDFYGLTRNTWPGTWSPSTEAPIVLDKETRGGLRSIIGSNGDRLEDITGQRLVSGMFVFVEKDYSIDSVGGSIWTLDSVPTTFQSGYYQYKNDSDRNEITGSLQNEVGFWSTINLEFDSSAVLSLIDSSYVKAFIDSDYLKGIIDSDYIKGFVDSDYIKGFIDSDYLKGIIDSDYIKGFIDSDYIKGFVDSDYLKGIIDSDYIKGFVDSDYIKGFIDSDYLKGFIDSDYIKGFVDSDYIKGFADSNYVNAFTAVFVDSDYIQARQIFGLDSALTIGLTIQPC